MDVDLNVQVLYIQEESSTRHQGNLMYSISNHDIHREQPKVCLNIKLSFYF